MDEQEFLAVARVRRTRAEARRSYDRLSAFYDLLVAAGEKPYRQAGLEMLAAQPGERILEIGSGTGLCLEELAAAVGEKGIVFGMDLSEGMNRVARGRLAKAGLDQKVGIGCADAAALPVRTGSFDGVLMTFTLELFDQSEFEGVLGEVRRALKPCGRLVVVSLSKEGRIGPATRLYEWGHERFPAALDCRPIYAERLLRTGGFETKARSMRYWGIAVEVVRAEVIR